MSSRHVSRKALPECHVELGSSSNPCTQRPFSPSESSRTTPLRWLRRRLPWWADHSNRTDRRHARVGGDGIIGRTAADMANRENAFLSHCRCLSRRVIDHDGKAHVAAILQNAVKSMEAKMGSLQKEVRRKRGSRRPSIPLAALTANVHGGLKGLQQGLLDVGMEAQEDSFSTPKVLPWEEGWRWQSAGKGEREHGRDLLRRKSRSRIAQSNEEEEEEEEEAVTASWVEMSGSAKREYRFLGVGNRAHLEARALSQDKSAMDKLGDILRDRFLPVGYPNSVSPGFLTYTCWHTVQECANAAISVISTQSLLLAAGLRPTPAQATIVSWVLKDGMQHVGKLIGSSMGARMDAEPKRWRLFADLMFDVGAGLEVLSPLCPNNFLSIAGVANLSKGVSLVAARATRLPIYNSFAKEGNLGDLHTKGEAIGVFSNLLGMAIGIHLASTVCSTMHGKIMTASVLSGIHLFACSREMRSTPLNTLNEQRTGMLIKDYLKTGKVPRPAELTHREVFILPREHNDNVGDVHFNIPVSNAVASPSVLNKLTKKFRGESFLLNFRDERTDMVLHQEATGEDTVRGWLLAACAAEIVREREGSKGESEDAGLDARIGANVPSKVDEVVRNRPGRGRRRTDLGLTIRNSDSMDRNHRLQGNHALRRGGPSPSGSSTDAIDQVSEGVEGIGSKRMAVLDEAYKRMEELLPPLLTGLREGGWHTHLFSESKVVRAAWQRN